MLYLCYTATVPLIERQRICFLNVRENYCYVQYFITFTCKAEWSRRVRYACGLITSYQALIRRELRNTWPTYHIPRDLHTRVSHYSIRRTVSSQHFYISQGRPTRHVRPTWANLRYHNSCRMLSTSSLTLIVTIQGENSKLLF